MNPNDIQSPGQPPRWPDQPPNKPQQPNRYAWQQQLGQQDPDVQIIPNPGNTPQQPFKNWPGQPPRPQVPQQLPPQPQYQPRPAVPPQQPEQPLPPMPPAPMQPPMRPPRKKKWIVWLLVLLLLAGAAAAYFFLKPSDGKDKKQSTTTTSSSAASDAARESSAAAESDTVDLATLQSAKLNAPNMDDYEIMAQDESFTRYKSKANGRCELGIGTLTATELAGTDLDNIIEIQLKALRESGATVSEPMAGAALALADSADASKKYNLATLKFELTKDNVRAKSRYSAVVLRDGNRAVVNRTCYTEDGSEVDEAGMEALDATAKQTTVTAG